MCGGCGPTTSYKTPMYSLTLVRTIPPDSEPTQVFLCLPWATNWILAPMVFGHNSVGTRTTHRGRWSGHDPNMPCSTREGQAGDVKVVLSGCLMCLAVVLCDAASLSRQVIDASDTTSISETNSKLRRQVCCFMGNAVLLASPVVLEPSLMSRHPFVYWSLHTQHVCTAFDICIGRAQLQSSSTSGEHHMGVVAEHFPEGCPHGSFV